MSTLSSKEKELVYGDLGYELVFIPRSLALELANTYTSLGTSQTWGEFKANVPAHVYEEVIERTSNSREAGKMPLPEDVFNSDDIFGYRDGDWPVWHRQEMLHWMPENIQEQYGTTQPSVLNGDYLELDPEKVHEIVKALEDQGYVCIEDVSLIREASYGNY